jgi:hypothetical protein
VLPEVLFVFNVSASKAFPPLVHAMLQANWLSLLHATSQSKPPRRSSLCVWQSTSSSLLSSFLYLICFLDVYFILCLHQVRIMLDR